MSSIEGLAAGQPSASGSPDRARLRAATEKLEAVFLSEMLAAARFGETPTSFGGGIGEDQFSSFLRDAQSEAMVRAGGIGLAERLFQNLTRGN